MIVKTEEGLVNVFCGDDGSHALLSAFVGDSNRPEVDKIEGLTDGSLAENVDVFRSDAKIDGSYVLCSSMGITDFCVVWFA